MHRKIKKAMLLVDTITALHEKIKSFGSTATIGFVPTMGALHKGHLSLVKQAHAETDVVVVSVFVNPTQFNNTADLDKYPRTLKEDLDLLDSLDCNIVFVPPFEEM